MPENNPTYRISVVIPAYNAEKFINRAIDSVLAQTLPVDEIIVINDGSTDNTAEIVKAYGQAVRYIQQENAGVSAARNRGIEEASGNWITFLDADDEWLPEKLAMQCEVLQRNPDLKWVLCNFVWEFVQKKQTRVSLDAGEVEKILNGKEYFDCYFDAFILGATSCSDSMMIKRDVFEICGRFKQGMQFAEDSDMWFRIAYHWPRIGYVSKPLAIYHYGTPTSLSQQTRGLPDIAELLERHLTLSRKAGRYDEFLPCAVHQLRFWIHSSLFDERIYHIRPVVKQFSNILPCSYVLALKILTLWPGMTLKLRPLFRIINKFLKVSI